MYRRVVLVEDDNTFRRVIARNLTRRGVRVYEAETAASAVATVLEVRPDLILLDINLPDRSGWDALRDLRRNGFDVPTIVMSVVRVTLALSEEFRLLASLTKPFALDALLPLVLGPANGSGLTPDGELDDTAIPRA